jgi:hypothetical protein
MELAPVDAARVDPDVGVRVRRVLVDDAEGARLGQRAPEIPVDQRLHPRGVGSPFAGEHQSVVAARRAAAAPVGLATLPVLPLLGVGDQAAASLLERHAGDRVVRQAMGADRLLAPVGRRRAGDVAHMGGAGAGHSDAEPNEDTARAHSCPAS